MNNVISLPIDRNAARAAAYLRYDACTDDDGLAGLLRVLGANLNELRLANSPLRVAVRRLHAAESLFHEGAAADSLHFVRAGTFKVVRTAGDGYEQVLGFAGRGEVLGFDAIASGTHPTAAVALEDSSAFAVPLREFFGGGPRLLALDTLVHRAVSKALASRGELADVMAAVAAEVRLARFLLQWSQRMAGCGQSPRRFHLRMSRRDIASFLGVAHETVSRSFGLLVRWGVVQVDNREVEVLDMLALKTLALSTRRPCDEPLPPPAQRSPQQA
jgi:CRP/FNR family transcriptional regulator